MDHNFYFRKEAEIVSGSANFASLISGSPVSFGLVAAQATSYGTFNTALQTKYALAIAPETRTPVVIAEKNIAKKNVQTNAKMLAQIIRATSSVTDAQLIALGLLPRSNPTPRPVPVEAPVIEVLSVAGRMAKARIHNALTESRAKAAGVVGANVFSYVGPTAPTDPREYHLEGLATRGTMQILFPNTVVSGATVWLSAQWVTARGQTSIGSTPISFTLPGGAIPAAEAA